MNKILVINNDVDTMSLLKMWLEKRDYDVKYTGNTNEVTALIREFKPGIILVDQPQVNVVDEIKKDHRDCQSIPIIMMTGYTTRICAGGKTIDAVIEKPFYPEALEKLLKKYF